MVKGRISNLITELLEENGFILLNISMQQDRHIAELETYSPEGEDFIIDIWFDGTPKSFVDSFAEYANDFDVDEHIAMWIEARNNGVKGVPDTRSLVHDAEAIKDMLLDMAAKLLATHENIMKIIKIPRERMV